MIRQTTIALLLLSVTIFATVPGIVRAQDIPAPQQPEIAPASDEGEQAILSFDYPKEQLTMRLFAAEPAVANPVALHVDNLGRVFVCETFRQENGVEDNREHPEWKNDDLAAQSVQDRINYIRKHFPDADTTYTQHDDRIRLLRDTDGDGVADTGTVFADRFNAIEMGTGAGVLSHNGNVYYTCIPDLFLLRDEDGDGVADKRQSLHTGYGVRFAFRGHDSHGLIVGPDGRLYFSIGDRGYNIVTEDGVLKDPASGAVFRCELDGSNLEVFATGLRNPQELAFDDYGNLFTGDNNSDSGDKARWVYVVPGGDSGWRMHYQYLGDRGPFNQERIWEPYSDLTPAYIVPPVINLSDGPSGLEYYPGTGFDDSFKERFFLADFRGNATVSGIRSFRCKQKGAFWEVVDQEQPFWKMLVTDLDFAPDGKLYLSDWVHGWQGVNKGRIYTIEDESKAAERTEVAALLKAPGDRTSQQLIELLGHADRRVRQQAQFALAKNDDGMRNFAAVCAAKGPVLARLHSIWGMGQMLRAEKATLSGTSLDAVLNCLADEEPELRAAAVQLVGETGSIELEPKVRTLLGDANARVRYHALLAMSGIGNEQSLSAISGCIESNTDDDPIIRHGGIMALVGTVGSMAGRLSDEEMQQWLEGWIDRAAGVETSRSRLALVIAIRKLHRPVAVLNLIDADQAAAMAQQLPLSRFLTDDDPAIVLEAARAIHDLSIKDQIEDLASLLDTPSEDQIPDPLARRILNANFRRGGQEHAERVAKFAADAKQITARRVDAMKMLADWGDPGDRDFLTGEWLPIAPRDSSVAASALGAQFDRIAGSRIGKIRRAALESAGALNLSEAAGLLVRIATDRREDVDARCSALRGLAEMNYDGLAKVLEKFGGNFLQNDPVLAGTVCEVAASVDEATGMRYIMTALGAPPSKREVPRYQMGIRALGMLDGKRSGQLLRANVLLIDTLPVAVRLDIMQAAEKRGGELAALAQAQVEKMKNDEDATAVFAYTLEGGDAERGREIFIGKTEVSCLRCHKIDGNGGEVGPDLSGIGLTRDRQYLLESIVTPNQEIAEGFTQQVIQTLDGDLFTGVVTSEEDGKIRLVDSEGVVTMIDVELIEGRRQGQSSMPEDLVEQLTQQEIRDLIEFLASRKTEPQPESDSDSGSHGE